MGIGLVLSEHKPNRAFKYLKFEMFFVWLGCGFGSIFLVIKEEKWRQNCSLYFWRHFFHFRLG